MKDVQGETDYFLGGTPSVHRKGTLYTMDSLSVVCGCMWYIDVDVFFGADDRWAAVLCSSRLAERRAFVEAHRCGLC